MKKIASNFIVLILILTSSLAFSQLKENNSLEDLLLNFKGNSIVVNNSQEVITFKENVSLDSSILNFTDAEQVIVDLKNQRIEILNCKNFKIRKKIKTVNYAIPKENNKNKVIYFIKEDRLEHNTAIYN